MTISALTDQYMAQGMDVAHAIAYAVSGGSHADQYDYPVAPYSGEGE